MGALTWLLELRVTVKMCLTKEGKTERMGDGAVVISKGAKVPSKPAWKEVGGT